MSEKIMTETNLANLIAQLEAYVQNARTQLGTDEAQDHYWRGVLFGLELALLEARKRQSPPERLLGQTKGPGTDEFFTRLNKLWVGQLEDRTCAVPARCTR